MANRASINKDLELDIEIDFEQVMPGSNVSDECLREIADRLRISARVPDILDDTPCISDDVDSILTQDANGCLRVQRDTFCQECITVPRPDPIQGTDGKVLLPIEANCISSIQLESGTVINIPNNGQTEDCSDTDPEDGWDATLTGAPFCLGDIIMTDGTIYTFPEIEGPVTLVELVDNAQAHADANSYPLTFSVNGSFFHIEHTGGLFLESVVDCGSDPAGFAIIDGPTEECNFVEPANTQEFIDNLNNEQSEITFELDEDGNICATPSLPGEEIVSVIQCDPEGQASSLVVNAVPIETEVPGDTEITFSECAASQGIDYTAVGILFEDISPRDGFDKVVRTAISNDEVTYRIERVTTDLEFCLKAFTPASPENVDEF